MAQNTTLQNLMDRCARRFDAGSSGYIDTTDGWPELINEAIAALHNELTTAGEGYVQTVSTIILVPGTRIYTLPGDFAHLIGCFLVSSSHYYMPLQRFMTKQYFGGPTTLPTTFIVPPLRYDLRGDSTGATMWFDPMPSQAGTVEIWYVPQYIPLVATNDHLPLWWPLGWEEYIVNYAVMRARIKEQQAGESDLKTILDEVRVRIERESINRDMMNTKRVVDASYGYGSGGWSGWPY